MKKRLFQISGDPNTPLDIALTGFDPHRSFILFYGPSQAPKNNPHLKALIANSGISSVVGCSTSGQIIGASLNDTDFVGVAIEFETTEVKTQEISLSQFSNSFSAGMELGRKLKRPDLKAVYILSEGVKINGSQLVSGLSECLGSGVSVTGGLAGDGTRFSETWIYSQGQFKGGVVTALGLYGPEVRIASGVQGGWEIFGPRRRVTRSKDNIVFEIDQKPALDLYKMYLGEQAENLPSSGLHYPLLIYPETDTKSKTVRTILGIDENNKSLIFAGDIPEGSYAQMMMSSKSQLIEGASQASMDLKAIEDGICLAVSCVGRRLVLAARAEEELESVTQSLPEQTPMVGFYSYGEIAPTEPGSPSALHNQTMTLTYISEVPAGGRRAG